MPSYADSRMNADGNKDLDCQLAAQQLEAYYRRRRGQAPLPNAEFVLVKRFIDCCGADAWADL